MNRLTITFTSFLSIFVLSCQAMSQLDKLENNLMSTHGRLFKEKVLTEYMRSDELQSWYRVVSQLYRFVSDNTKKFEKELLMISKINAQLIVDLLTNYVNNIAPALPQAKKLTGIKNLADLNWKKLKVTNVVFQLKETLKQRLVLHDLRDTLEAGKHFWDSRATKDSRAALLFFIEILDAVIARMSNEITQMRTYESKLLKTSHKNTSPIR